MYIDRVALLLLRDVLARELLRRINSGEADSDVLAVAADFLDAEGVHAAPSEAPPAR